MDLRIFFIPNVYATTFWRYQEQLESLAYGENFLRENPEARVAALPASFTPVERRRWTYDPNLTMANKSQHRGVFVVPFYRGRFTLAQVLDKGPWVTDNPYWRLGARPRAETLHSEGSGVYSPQRQEWIKVVHPAGVDFTPQVWVDLGVPDDVAYGERFSARVDLAIVERM